MTIPMQSTKEKQGIMIETTDVLGADAMTALRVFDEVIDPVDPKDLRTEEAMIVRHALQGIVIVEDLPGEANDHLTLEGGSACLLYTSPSPRDRTRSRMPSSA